MGICPFGCLQFFHANKFLSLSPASGLLPRATKLISVKWQKLWNNCTCNKFQSINPTIGVYQHVRSLPRRDAVIIHRLRIGHTLLTHSFVVWHWWTGVFGLSLPTNSQAHSDWMSALTSNKHFTASSMKDLFDNVAAQNINFIKESHFIMI